MKILEAELAKMSKEGSTTLAGNVAFTLYDTFGFPFDLTADVGRERGVTIDEAGFDAAMDKQRDQARAAGKFKAEAGLAYEGGKTQFRGYDTLSDEGRVVALYRDGTPVQSLAQGEKGIVVLDRTPFYAESGGQVGDTGTIETDTGTAEVLDTVYGAPGLVRHVIGPVTGTITVGQQATLAIDGERRNAIRRNHTATHILHWALRQVLGDHVKQQGSLVDPDRLRFDFSHFEGLSDEQIREVEDLANHEILSNKPVRHYETTKAHAAELGAIAFFGDKYGDIVRVLEAGDHSIELCGGTHVGALGDIGPAKIVSEGSIGSNIRRVEAVTGFGPIERLRSRETALEAAADAIGVPTDDLLEGISKRLGELKSLRDEVATLRRAAASASAGDLLDQAVDGCIVALVEAEDRDTVRDMAVSLRDRPGIRAVVLGSSPGGKGVAIVGAVTPDSGLDAGQLIAEAVKMVGGGGGKGAELATAGGRDPSQLAAALDHVRSSLGIS
jgi:alanyl-tRNA synthetase